MADGTSSESGKVTLWVTLNRLPRGSSRGHHSEPLALQGAHDPSTRGLIERYRFNILWASFVTFKLPQSPGLKSLFHSLSFALHSRLSAIFVLPAHYPSPTTPILKGTIFFPSMTLLLHCLALDSDVCSLFSDAYVWRRLTSATLYLGDVPPWRHLLLAMPCLGDAYVWRRLTLAMPLFGDAYVWRRLILATPDATLSFCLLSF